MFESLKKRPLDPILGVGLLCAADENVNKVNLGVGVYRDEQGESPIFASVKAAERHLLDSQQSKAYVGQAGDPLFLDHVTRLLLGDQLAADQSDRLAASTTVGGSGALRLAAELAKLAKPETTFWVSRPTWGNHRPLLSAAGVPVVEYDYYDPETGAVDFEAMMRSLAEVAAGDVVVLHACCHNPTGADLTASQWNEVCNLALKRRFVPLLDVAYLGFGESLEADSVAVRQAVEKLPEVLVAMSGSKSFGVYRERAGMLLLLGANSAAAEAALSNVLSIARSAYSMPGYHGAAVLATVLEQSELRLGWQSELEAARLRVQSLRLRFASQLNNAQDVKDFGFLGGQRGMFSLLGLTDGQVTLLRQKYSVYLVGAARANMAGLSEANLDRVVNAISQVLTQKSH